MTAIIDKPIAFETLVADMGLDRRTFLQQAGLALFTWGATEAGVSSLANSNLLAASIKNYQQTLAQPTNRKLALLVGINRYPHQEDLAGCITDVELQRELLIHRFGFQADDIITLRDRQATREDIETAFIEHLTKQAKPDDVVVFHFSGYGGQIKMPLSFDGEVAQTTASSEAFRLVNSFIPADGLSSSKKSLANSILQETLLILAQSLSTTKCTFVLDTSFSTTPRSKHGSLKIRSLDRLVEKVSPQELAFIEQLKENLAVKGLKPSKRLLSLPGVVLSAAGKNQVAAERQWNELSAGLFTQALTQHLWHLTPSAKMQVALIRAAETVEQVMGRQQQPTLNNPDRQEIGYYLATSNADNATGIISQVNKNGNVEVKLLGLPANLWDKYGVDSCFSLVSSPKNNASVLRVQSKEGIVATTKLLSAADSVKVGQLVRESIRILKRDLSLNLALDDDLQRIERVDATSAIANIPAVDSVVVSPENNADCLLGKVASTPAETTATDSEPENSTFSYGLYTAAGNLIGKTAGLAEEAVKIAVERLQPQFNSLLAAKWLALTDNEFSSGLKVSASIITGEKKQSSGWQKATLTVDNLQPLSKKSFLASSSNPEINRELPLLAKGAEIRVSLNNLESRSLYAVVLGIDSDCNIYALYTPVQAANAEAEVQLENIEIAAGDRLTIPTSESSWKWKVPESVGINTLYVILAVKPFTKTLKAFATQQNFKLDQQQVLNVTNPVAVTKALMQDLHNASSVADKSGESAYALDVNSWASLNFVYEVINT